MKTGANEITFERCQGLNSNIKYRSLVRNSKTRPTACTVCNMEHRWVW